MYYPDRWCISECLTYDVFRTCVVSSLPQGTPTHGKVRGSRVICKQYFNLFCFTKRDDKIHVETVIRDHFRDHNFFCEPLKCLSVWFPSINIVGDLTPKFWQDGCGGIYDERLICFIKLKVTSIRLTDTKLSDVLVIKGCSINLSFTINFIRTFLRVKVTSFSFQI